MKNPDNLPLVIPQIPEDIYKQYSVFMKNLKDKHKPVTFIHGWREPSINIQPKMALVVLKHRTKKPENGFTAHFDPMPIISL